MKIITLIENNSYREEIAEQYGLSLYVQTQHGDLLVDAGQDDTALMNFRTMELDVGRIDAIVVSHNHYDHIGGLQSFVDATADRAVPVYISADSQNTLYSKRFLRKRKLVSRNELIQGLGDRARYVEDCTQILPDVYVCRVANPDPVYSCKDRKLRMLDGRGHLVPDDFRHEIYLAVVEDGSVKIVSSCSHNGIVNILKDVKNRFELPVSAFVGGLHLRGRNADSLNCSKAHVKAMAKEIAHLQVGAIHTCHCTGYKGFAMLQQLLPNEITYFSSGDSFEV